MGTPHNMQSMTPTGGSVQPPPPNPSAIVSKQSRQPISEPFWHKKGCEGVGLKRNGDAEARKKKKSRRCRRLK
jgi:hypothetical protein